jgi:hypothetical protein
VELNQQLLLAVFNTVFTHLQLLVHHLSQFTILAQMGMLNTLLLLAVVVVEWIWVEAVEAVEFLLVYILLKDQRRYHSPLVMVVLVVQQVVVDIGQMVLQDHNQELINLLFLQQAVVIQHLEC